MEYSRHADEGTIDPVSTEKMLVFSSIFAHSVKNAVVDLALGDLENEDNKPWKKLDTQMGR